LVDTARALDLRPPIDPARISRALASAFSICSIGISVCDAIQQPGTRCCSCEDHDHSFVDAQVQTTHQNANGSAPHKISLWRFRGESQKVGSATAK
jgi:hypothetical protein